MAVMKVVELVGTSRKGWEDAVEQVFREASDSLRKIHGLRVVHQATHVVAGRVREYLATCRVAYELEVGDHLPADQRPAVSVKVQPSV